MYPRPLTGWQPLFSREIKLTIRASADGNYEEQVIRIKKGQELGVYFPTLTDEMVKVGWFDDRIVVRSMFFTMVDMDVSDEMKSCHIFLMEDRAYMPLGGGVEIKNPNSNRWRDEFAEMWRDSGTMIYNSGTTTDINYSGLYNNSGTTNTVHYDNSTASNWR